ncbi:LPS assembly protein LptD, partial [bacterium]|nr:LPS assembly protein LptD [bacterium]
MKFSVPVYLAVFLFFLSIMPGTGLAQGLMQSTDDSNLFDKFQDEQFLEKTDQEVIQEEFKKKRAAYESLMSRESPVFFQADTQEIDEKTRIFILSGNVEIWKDMFSLKADWVRIHQWSGEIEARGNVVLEFSKDVLTGDEASYNFNTGTGWLSNARAAIEPQLYMEAETLVKLPDLESNGEGQYVLHDGMVTACSSKTPAWHFDTRYAVIRLENYVHMNSVSAWIKNMPVFWTPYFFFPTKTGRATGLLTPDVKWSSSRGLILSQEFFLCINDYMDATVGLTYNSIIGIQEEFQFRNAFNKFSKGELYFEHIKEDKSPSDYRDPEERWKISYEQNAMFPADIRGTANLNYMSDEEFDEDYGSIDQGINRYLDSRISLTKYWGTASLTLDGTYEKDYNIAQDARLEHLPRIEYYTGWKNLVGDLRWQMRIKGERLFKADNATATGETEDGSWSEQRRLEKDTMRGNIFGEIWYEFNEIPWMNITPWVSVTEHFWDKRKTFDQDFSGGTWATYDEIPEESENDWKAGLRDSGDGFHRHMFRTGIDLTGPKIYRIFDILGYERLSRMKHIIEPKISYDYTPELFGQEEILYFDREDFVEPGTKLTYSLTTRILMKLLPKKKKKKKKTDKDSGSITENSEEQEFEEKDSKELDDEDESSTDKQTVSEKEGEIREFGYLTISQTYDFFKDDHWEEREVQTGEDERIYYPYGNIKMDMTINPFPNTYFSGRIEYDPWHDEFSNGYIYGNLKRKKWEFGLRWDFTRNFLDEYYDLHALAVEGGMHLNDKWSFSSWIKYDFSKEYSPYAYVDLTYMAQCWGITLHTYFKNNRDYNAVTRDYEDDNEIKFGLSFHLKNVDTIDTDSF